MTPKAIRDQARKHFVGEPEGDFHFKDCVCIEKKVEEAIAAERERCAKIADKWAQNEGRVSVRRNTAEGIAKEIRDASE